MKKANKVLLFIISFISAVFLWIVVMNLAKPLIDDHINVPIEIKAEDGQNMKEKGHVYTLNDIKSVRVNYKVRSDQASDVKNGSIRAYVEVFNTTNLSDNLQVHIEYTDPRLESMLSSVNIYPQLVGVRVSDLETRYFDINANNIGTLSDNASIGNIMINPSGVSVSAIKEDLDRINEVRANIVLDGHNDTFTGVSDIKLLNKDKREIPINQNIFVSDNDVDYTVLVYHTKEISLNPVVSGEVINGCFLESVSANPNKIIISGPRSFLDNINSLDLPEASITGVSESKVVESFDIASLLPSGIQYIGSEEKVDVEVVVSGSPKVIIAPKVVEE